MPLLVALRLWKKEREKMERALPVDRAVEQLRTKAALEGDGGCGESATS